ncbi:hypothetical protein IQ249_22265 [Lusitaniella coriacea LEGE 07157]|uniref:Uncharacterized protein n=1 Tax=Lusitaniella coriacea LEGE 07157 TaxID=945747 RepID=A0A8J7IXB6_9CYAN|nr:hypothetical protein [Lusitaniella coriacea]MBE9118618.1 hypothetical protein [Lusitaniella coriacea LEGE 07157]
MNKYSSEPAKILQELEALAFSDISKVVDFDSEAAIVRDSTDLSQTVTSAIRKISISKHRNRATINVENYPKSSALKLLAKISGLDTDLNNAIAVLARYGLIVSRDESGKWTLFDVQSAK